MGGGRNGDKQSTNAGSCYLSNPYAKKPGTDIPVHINSRRKPPTGLQPKDLCLIPERVAIAAQQDGWIIRNMIIWHKTNPMPCSAKDRCTRSYEHIIVMVKQKKYYWDRKAAQEPQAPAGKKRIALANSRRLKPTDKQFKRSSQCAVRGANTTDGLVKSRRSFTKPGTGRNDAGRVITDNGMRNLRDVWRFNVGNFGGAHFATFPLELPLRCIKLASRPGDIVLDPFNGSGTTAVAAAQLGREYIGLDRAYLDLAAQRVLDFEIEAKRTDHAVILEMIGKLGG
jgi:DNA modification methylase